MAKTKGPKKMRNPRKEGINKSKGSLNPGNYHENSPNNGHCCSVDRNIMAIHAVIPNYRNTNYRLPLLPAEFPAAWKAK